MQLKNKLRIKILLASAAIMLMQLAPKLSYSAEYESLSSVPKEATIYQVINKQVPGKFIKVVDGDTIKITNLDKSIRFTQFDTPESFVTQKTAWDSYNTDYPVRSIVRLGKLSTLKLKSCINTHGLVITKLMTTAQGRYIVLLDNDSKLMSCMLQNGYAYYNDNDKPNSKDNLVVFSYIEHARKNNLGLWKIDSELMTRLTNRSYYGTRTISK